MLTYMGQCGKQVGCHRCRPKPKKDSFVPVSETNVRLLRRLGVDMSELADLRERARQQEQAGIRRRQELIDAQNAARAYRDNIDLSYVSPSGQPISKKRVPLPQENTQKFLQKIGMLSNCNVMAQEWRSANFSMGGLGSHRLVCSICQAVEEVGNATSLIQAGAVSAQIEEFCALHRHDGSMLRVDEESSERYFRDDD